MPEETAAPFLDESADPPVRGFLHRPANSTGVALVLTHGAGSNCQSSLLLTLVARFVEAGIAVLRCDLPFRQARPHGPPYRDDAARDRAGLRNAVAALRAQAPGRMFVGGHSYGGRQASMLLAEAAGLVEGLFLLSYPLHPPRKPAQLRTAHFPLLTTPALFVHGSRDPFGSLDEMAAALKLIPARTKLLAVAGAAHDLVLGRRRKEVGVLLPDVVKEFQTFFGLSV